MSQPDSGAGFSLDGTQTNQQHGPNQGRQNGRASADILGDRSKSDLSNGFEIRRNQIHPQPIQSENEIQGNQQQQSTAKNHMQQQNHHQQTQQQQQSQQQHIEERPPSVPILLTHQPYHDNILIDRVQFISQGGAQSIPIHAAQFAPEYVIATPADSLQYSQIHPAVFNASQGQYVSRDPSFRDPNLYNQNVALAAAPGTYVQHATQSQIPSQTASAQPPTYYTNKVPGLPPQVATGYVHFPPQIHYSQYPQTVMNSAPYNMQKNIYPQQYSQQQPHQQPSSQHSPNPQRISQELSQYQNQSITQPIAQNVHTVASANNDRTCRGPKPMVPPRINSKITHESAHRKCASVDVSTSQNPKRDENDPSDNQEIDESQHQQVQADQDNQEKRYVVTINHNPRTRQDGLYVEKKRDSSREKTVSKDPGNADSGIYVSRSEHRKSVSVDVTSSFQKRNDTITFTFPSDGNTQHDQLLVSRKPISSANVEDNKGADMNATNFPTEQKRLDINPGMRMSPMPMLPSLNSVPKGILVSGERKSVEWSTLSPNQRVVVPQENRRSDYFEEHRRSPLTVEGKRFEEIRRSPMAFVPIRDANATDQANQKSPNNTPNQNFEKTRAELAVWAEQRKRQEIDGGRIMSNREMYTTSPRSRNPSEERRPENSRSYIQLDKETRMAVPQSAFQPIANITQNSLMEQRRHLRHVSADLTKHIENSRKEFDDQHLTGSVVNLDTTSTPTSTTNAMSQRANPNVGYQYPAQSEAKSGTKTPLTIVTDFNEASSKSAEQRDHIIHSHRKSQNLSANLLSIGNNQENPQKQSEQTNDKTNFQQPQSHHPHHSQHSIHFISEKLSQCERQQSDLHAKVQSLQSQNEILDKVAQLQHQQNDLHARMHNLQMQNQLANKFSLNQNSEFAHSSSRDDEETNQSILNQCINAALASRHLYQPTLLTAIPQIQATSYLSERVSPRMQYQQQMQEESDHGSSLQIPNISQMPLPSLSQFDRADILTRGPYTQLHHDGIPCSQMNLPPSGAANSTGALKKVPPEKPPRTSLIVQSPDAEVNVMQIASCMTFMCVHVASFRGMRCLFCFKNPITQLSHFSPVFIASVYLRMFIRTIQ